MAVKTKIDPIAETLKVMVNQSMSRTAQQQAVASFAAGSIAEADSANRRILGRVPPKTVTVDGVAGAPLSSVNPQGGTIIAEWDLATDVLVWIGDTLRARSPFVSGDYQRGWTLLADNVEVTVGENIPASSEYTFVNTVPYARKIEVGKTESGRAFVIQVPNRIAERTAKDAASRFGNIARIRSVWISLTSAYTLKHDQASRSFASGHLRISKKQRPDRVAGSAITYPAISVILGRD